MVDLVIVGTMALDDIETPFGKKEGVLGGSGSYAGIAASFFAKSGIVSVIGEDFPQEHLDLLSGKGLDLSGVEKSGKTFRWSGSYEYDMNEAKTKETQLNSLATFKPKLPDEYKNARFLFLANIDPDLQLSVIGQFNKLCEPLTRPNGHPLPPSFAQGYGRAQKGEGRGEGETRAGDYRDHRHPFILLDTMNFWITSKRESLVKVIEKVDALVINDAEARQLTETPNLITAGRKLLDMGPEYVIIKKGEHGALMFSHEIHFSAPSYPLEELRDPTGAGDSFAGGLIGYLASQNNTDQGTIRKGMIYGSCVASFCAEGFSVERVKEISKKDVDERYEIFKKIREF